MSKLTDVRTELAANPAVSIVKDRQKNFMSAAGLWNHWVDIIVAPSSGLYTAKELQKFMDGLVTIAPTQSDHFHQYETGMAFGTSSTSTRRSARSSPPALRRSRSPIPTSSHRTTTRKVS